MLGVREVELRFDTNELANINLVAGDTATRGFLISLIGNNGEFIPANNNIKVTLYAENSNYPGKIYFNEGSIKEDKYLVYFTSDMISKQGIVEYQIRAMSSDGTAIIFSKPYRRQVELCIANGGTVGHDVVVDFSKLTEAINNVLVLEQNYGLALDEQHLLHDDVVRKHTDVKNMYGTLSGVFDSETVRIEAEKIRVANENARKTAETTRAANENARKTAETARATKETERQTAETARIREEDIRIENEKARIEAENKRKSAESTRVTAESNRSTEEVKRVEQYKKMTELMTVLGDNPTVEIAEEVTKLKAEDKVILDKLQAIKDNIDNLADYDFDGQNYIKSKFYVKLGKAYYDSENIGFRVKNDIIKHTFTGSDWSRLYFKAKTDLAGVDNILVYNLTDDRIRYAPKITNLAGQYAIDVFNATEVLFNTTTIPDKNVSIWDIKPVKVDGIVIKNDIKKVPIMADGGKLRFIVSQDMAEDGHILIYDLADTTKRFAIKVTNYRQDYELEVGSLKEIVINTTTLPTSTVKLEWR